MQIHFEPHYAAGFEPLIRAFPKTPVLIDNLGRPFQATPEEFARVLRWSRLPNVHMKLSGFPNPAEYPFRDIRPTLKQIISGFGPDRLVWGGTFGVGATADSYKAGRAAIGAHLADLPAADQANILGGTAARLFHFATRVKRAVFTVVLLLAPACRRQVPPPPLPPTPIAAVWAVGDGDTLERDARDAPTTSELWDGRTVKLFAAGNEIVAFQLIVRAGQPGIRQLRASLPELGPLRARARRCGTRRRATTLRIFAAGTSPSSPSTT